jgi:hypothetical protein
MMGKETDGNLAVVAAEMNEWVGAVARMVALVMNGSRGSRSTKALQKTEQDSGLKTSPTSRGHLIRGRRKRKQTAEGKRSC